MSNKLSKTSLKKFGALSVLVLFLVTIAMPFISTESVYAISDNDGTVTADYVNYNQINITNTFPADYRKLNEQQGKFTLDKAEKHMCAAGASSCVDLYYTPTGSGSGNTTGSCVPQIKVEANAGSGLPYHDTIHVDLQKHSSDGSTNCVTLEKNVVPSNYANSSRLLFDWVDSTILRPVGLLPIAKGSKTGENILIKLGDFSIQTDGSYANSADSPKCTSKVTDISSDHTTGQLKLWSQGGSSCDGEYESPLTVHLGGADKATLAHDPNVAPQASGGSANGGDGGSNNTATCESSANVLGWIICPIITGLAKTIGGAYTYLIEPFLKTQPQTLGTDSGNFKVWSTFRIIGDTLLVVALLVIVFGQSIGGGLIDAYSVKKILPRILAAAILINLSYYIVALAIDVTNVIGYGIQDLILTPFDAAKNGIKIGNETVGIDSLLAGGTAYLTAGIFSTGAAAIAGGALFEALPIIALTVLLPALLIVLAILATLILRQGIITFCLLSSPIAFALYCLPNTEQYFKKWWDLLIKTLMVFPIVSILFALSNVMAITIANASINIVADSIKPIFIIIALFMPLVLIPFAFKLAGGVIGRIHEIATSNGKRMVEGIKGNPNDPDSLQNRLRRETRAKMNERNISGRAIGEQLNLRTRRSPERRAANLAAIRNTNHAVLSKKGASQAMYEANSQDSNVTGDLAKYATGEASRAAASMDYLHEQALAENELRDGNIDNAQFQQRLSAAQGNYQQRLFSSATADKIGRTVDMRRQALLNPSTIGYEIDPGEAGWDQATALMQELSGGNEGVYRSMVNTFQYVAKSSAGRADLAGATDGKPYSYKTAWSTQSLYQLGAGKPKVISSIGDRFRQQLEQAKLDMHLSPVNSPEYKAAEESAAEAGRFYKELDAISKGATGGVRDAAMEQKAKFEKADIGAVMAQGSASNPGKTINDLAKNGARSYEHEAEHVAHAAQDGH